MSILVSCLRYDSMGEKWCRLFMEYLQVTKHLTNVSTEVVSRFLYISFVRYFKENKFRAVQEKTYIFITTFYTDICCQHCFGLVLHGLPDVDNRWYRFSQKL